MIVLEIVSRFVANDNSGFILNANKDTSIKRNILHIYLYTEINTLKMMLNDSLVL